MARGNLKKKKMAGPFYALYHRMIDSVAWQSLSPTSTKVFIQLMRKHNGNNGKDLSLTYSEMKGIVAPATLSKCITELVEHGFIDVIRQGGLQKQCNIFGQSERWKAFGTDTFEHRTREKWNYGGFRKQSKISEASTENESA